MVFATAVAAATARLAPQTVPVPVHGMVVPVPVTGDVNYATRDGTADVQGRLTGDLAAAQKQSTALLQALLDRDARCGDYIAVRDGKLGAQAPALRVTGTVDYGRKACLSGKEITVVPRSPVFVDMLLYPVVAPRSLRVRAEILELRPQDASMPASAIAPLKEALSRVVSQRIGELFPAGSVPADVALKSLSFAEAKGGGLIAQVEGSGKLPQATLDQFIQRR